MRLSLLMVVICLVMAGCTNFKTDFPLIEAMEADELPGFDGTEGSAIVNGDPLNYKVEKSETDNIYVVSLSDDSGFCVKLFGLFLHVRDDIYLLEGYAPPEEAPSCEEQTFADAVLGDLNIVLYDDGYLYGFDTSEMGRYRDILERNGYSAADYQERYGTVHIMMQDKDRILAFFKIISEDPIFKEEPYFPPADEALEALANASETLRAVMP